MSTVVKLFTFDSTAESWYAGASFNGGDGSDLAGGSAPGSLSFGATAAAGFHNFGEGQWGGPAGSYTWESLGVPAGQTVSGLGLRFRLKKTAEVGSPTALDLEFDLHWWNGASAFLISTPVAQSLLGVDSAWHTYSGSTSIAPSVGNSDRRILLSLIVSITAPGSNLASFAGLFDSVELTVSYGPRIAITPHEVTLAPLATQAFTTNLSAGFTVTEGAPGGSVTPGSGTSTTYTAPATPGVYHLLATDSGDATDTDTATITVTSLGAAGPVLSVDQWLLTSGGVPTADERTWLWNAGAGRTGAAIAAYCAEAGDALNHFGACPCTRTVRQIPAALLAHLQGQVLTLALCAKLVRADGTIQGFTTLDRDLTVAGVRYSSVEGAAPSALRQDMGGAVDTLDLTGLLDAGAVTQDDLLAGLYDGASLTLYLVNWSAPSQVMTLHRGTLGEVRLQDGQYTCEFRSLAQRLALTVGEQYSPFCRVRALGDARCAPGGSFDGGATLVDFQFGRLVDSAEDGRNITFAGDASASGYYTYGRVIFTSGANASLSREIKSHVNSGGTAVLELQEGFPFLPAPGDRATLEAGCDRLLTTCNARFSNVVNFQGEPDLPGHHRTKQRGAKAGLSVSRRG